MTVPRAIAASLIVVAAVGCGPPPRPSRAPGAVHGATGERAARGSGGTSRGADGDGAPAAAVVYTVVQGDNLIALARRFHVAGGVDALVRLNALARADRIRDGQGLLVPRNPPFTDDQPAYRPPVRFERPLRACGALARGATPVEQPLAGCARAACARAGAAEACACVAPDPTQSGFVVRVGGAARARWTGLPFLGDPTAFDLAHGDLDGDGAAETVVAVLESEAGGIATRAWSVRVFAGAAGAAPLRVRVDEYGEGTFLAREGAPRGCELLATEWAWLRDPLRGDGMYLTARRYAVRAGALAPVAGAPVLARRLLTDFRAEASAGRPARLGAPAAWMGEGRAEVWPADPALEGAEREAREGELLGARVEADASSAATTQRGPRLEVRWRGEPAGAASVVLEARSGRAAPDEPARYERLGDAATRAVFPVGYAPATLEGWRGAAVRAAAYQDARGEVHRVVWLGTAR